MGRIHFLALMGVVFGFFSSANAEPLDGEARLRGGAGTSLGGLAAVVFAHESFHGLTAWGLGAEIVWFRPYPHVLNGDLVAGSVKHRLEPKAGETARDLHRKRAWIAASGSLGTLITSVAVAPLIPQTDSDTLASFLFHYQDWALIDWPAYVTADLIIGFFKEEKIVGDWSKVSVFTGVPLWAYLITSYASAYLVYQHNQHFVEQAIEDYNVRNGISSTSYAPIFAAKWHY